jgi:phage gpG-like protein
MANVHQFGLKDKPGRNGKAIPYDARPLIGIDKESIQLVENTILIRLLEG